MSKRSVEILDSILKKIEKMMWKVPQFVMAKLKGES